MSPKELLYIEDTLGHQQQIKACCTESAAKVEDAELKDLITQISQRQGECFKRFYGLLN